MYLKMAKRVLLETDKRLVWKFMRLMGWKGMRSVQKHKRRLKKGEYFPPFLYVSVINSCNLRCQGCWVDVAAKQQTIDLEAMNRLISEAKEMGNVFFGIVGGEPFMHPELLEIFEANPDCYFQVFTNGQFITDEKAKRLRQLGNVTPLISVEGNEIVSNERRGREDVFNKTMEGIQNCLNNRLLTGVCTSVCRTNIDDLVNEEWVDRLIEMGVMYTWFHIFRPMGPDSNPDLCLTPEQQLHVRKFVSEMRAKKPIAIVDAYFDGEGKALCPAATGLSHHINPWGGIEPCPIIQFVTDDIHDREKTLTEKFNSPFMRDFRQLSQETTRGCIVLERPDLLRKLVDDHGAKDGTVRGTAAAELDAMQVRTSQYNPGNEIREASWVYRLVKRFLFYDFGVYDGHDESHSQLSAPALVELQTDGNASADQNDELLPVISQ
jgi:MoaA/NifB/PqqE/SkfB family radical SAM enzyme